MEAKQVDDKQVCALCGRAHKFESGAWRLVYKGRNGLRPGYYQPRLTEMELFSLPDQQVPVCTNRNACLDRQAKKAAQS